MKTIKILKWAGITAVACVSANTFAMGAKAPSEVTQILDMIKTNQENINNLETELFQPLDPMPVINNKTTEQQLMAIEKEQGQKIADLTKAVSDRDIQNKKTEHDASVAGNAQLDNGNMDTTPTKWVEARCNTLFDSLDSVQSIIQGRTAWAAKCIKAYEVKVSTESDAYFQKTGAFDFNLEDQKFVAEASLTLITRFSGTPYGSAQRWFYPSFGKTDASGQPVNPLRIAAPVNGAEDCGTSYQVDSKTPFKTDILADAHYQLVAMCVSGCYTPDQTLVFKDGVQEIGNAFDQKNMEIETLAEDSTLENPKYRISELEAYTVDIAPARQEVIDFETLSGKKLSVTKNHPLLDSEGKMRTADSFKTGECLVLQDGSADPIVLINEREYFGKVYNVRPKSTKLLENIVVAEGVLSGSVYFQNEGTKDLNRALFRINLPKEIIQ